MAIRTEYRYVVTDESGDSFIDGTRISVAQIARALDFGKHAAESDIEKLVNAYPAGYLTRSKVHEALAYFFDHREDVLSHLRPFPPSHAVQDEKGNYVIKG